MKNNKTLTVALAALFTSGMAMADMEVSGKIILEHAALTEEGSTIGSTVVNTGFTAFKDEFKVQLIADGDVTGNTTFHVEAMGFANQSATANYQGIQSDTQRDGFRELYVDSSALGAGWDLRLGKQQVVWGTADGMKLLDAINPTDYSEMAQNQMEDSRITVWAANGEKTFADGSNVQIVLSEAKPNVMPGLNNIAHNSTRSVSVTRGAGGFGTAQTSMVKTTASVDADHVFMMKGVDAISGKSNGILNIIPELAAVANTFSALGAAFTPANGAGFHLENWDYATVEEFVNNTGGGANFGGACNPASNGYGLGNAGSAYCLQQIAADTNAGNANLLTGMDSAVTNGAGTWDQVTPDTAFEYMPDATFKTFATFSSATSKYVREGAEGKTNIGLRFSDATKNGLNYSLNFMQGADANPHIELEWQNAAGGVLTPSLVIDTNGNGAPGSVVTGYRSVVLTDTDGNTNYGSIGGSATNGTFTLPNPVTLVLKEKNATISQTGGSFDTSFETAAFGPVVFRGEALYQQGVMTPIVDKAQMSVGNITEAFTSLKGDRFKYVLGLDITVLTNMMISGQIIGDNNLDYVDTTTTLANSGAATYSTDVVGGRYTADMASMSMQNQYQKAIKNKNFYSLFFSKPFGASGQNRWSNILMIEEGVGENAHWNRFDVDFGISDDVVATVEVNTYGGNLNTQFGQMDKSDNMQVGVKYSF